MSRRVRDYFELVSPRWDVMRKDFYGEEVRDAALNARRVIALDFSRGMSDEAIAKLGKGKVEFRIGNVERMQLPDSSVNVVIGNMVLHHCPHPKVGVAEMSRVLKPGGRIAFSDLQEHS